MTEFEDAQNIIRSISKQALGSKSYKDEVVLNHSVDLSPDEYAAYTYNDLINSYERIGKILSTQKLLGVAKPAKTVEDTKKTEEVVKNVMNITSKSLEDASAIKEEMQKAPVDSSLTFEKMTHDESSKETPTVENLEPSSDSIFEKSVESAPSKEVSQPPLKVIEEQPLPSQKVQEEVVPEPPVIVKLPQKEEDVEKKIESQSQAHQKYADLDNTALKKKMLELTKSLFKETNTSRRNEIKSEISVIKDLLSQTETKRRKEGDVALMLDGMLKSQSEELGSAKEHIIRQFEDRLSQTRDSFYAAVADMKNQNASKEQHESFIKKITAISAQIEPTIEQYSQLLEQKHLQELNAVLSKLESNDPLAKKIAEEQKKTKKYASILAEAKDSLEKKFESIMESGLEATNSPSSDDTKNLQEIKQMDEQELLNYLLAHDASTYKKYQLKKLSKHEALTKARVLVAQEKGISDKSIRSYFGEDS